MLQVVSQSRHLWRWMAAAASIKGTITMQSLAKSPGHHLSDSETYYSSFHSTPKRRKYSKEEWDKLTRDHTKKALEELVSSPHFSKWAVANAERITLTPIKKDSSEAGGWTSLFNLAVMS
ncbi:hypothetical protein Dimus_005492 [Dionaea muscipula]